MEGDEEFDEERFDVPQRTKVVAEVQEVVAERTFLTACWIPQRSKGAGDDREFLEVPTLLDEGASASFMAEWYFREHRDEMESSEVNRGASNFRNASGGAVKVRGTIRLGLHLAPGRESVKALLLLADLDPKGPALILGQSTLSTMRHVRNNTSPFFMSVDFESAGVTHIVDKGTGKVAVLPTTRAQRLLECASAPRKAVRRHDEPTATGTEQGTTSTSSIHSTSQAELEARRQGTVGDFGSWRDKVTVRPTRLEWEEKLSHVDPDYLEETIELVMEYSDVWYMSGFLPELGSEFAFDLELKEGAPSCIRRQAFPIRDRERRNLLNDQLEAECEGGLIREVEMGEVIHFTSPVFFKKEGGKYRRVTDYTEVNRWTKHSGFGVPNLEEILATLSGGAFYLQLDVKSAYTQLPLTKEAQKLLAFTAPGRDGRPRYFVPLRATFGATDLPSHYTRITALFDELSESIRTYIDDINAKVPDMRKGLDLLKRILELARELGLQLAFKKAHLFERQAKVLGQLLDANGRRPDPTRIKALMEWRCPSTSAEVRQFLGLYTYVSSALPNAVDANVQVLHRAASGAQAQLDEREDFVLAFEAVRRKAGEHILLSPYDPERLVRITTDSSAAAMGAILEQKPPGEDEFRTVFLFSRAWPEVASRYPAHDLECTAVVAALKRFRSTLHCQRVHLVTDCLTAVRALTTTPVDLLSAKLQRHRMFLDSSYQVTIEHRAAKYVVVADALSRQSIYERGRRLEAAHGLHYGPMGEGEPLASLYNDIVVPARQLGDFAAEAEALDLIETGPSGEGNLRAAASLAGLGQHLEGQVERLQADVGLYAMVNGDLDDDALPSDEIFSSDWLMRLRAEQKKDPEAAEIIRRLRNGATATGTAEEHERAGPSAVQGPVTPTTAGDKINDRYGVKAAVPRIDFSITRPGAEGLLVRRAAVSGAVWHSYWIPPSMRSDVLALVHGDPAHGEGSGRHPGRAKMMHLLKDEYYWPGMAKDVTKHVASCRVCQLGKRQATPKAGNYAVRYATDIFETISVDLMDFAKNPSFGYRYLLVAQDLCTRFLFLVPLKTKQAAEVAQAFWERVVTLIGPPDAVLVDGGGEFKGAFTRLLNRLGSNHVLGLAYHPQSNAANERSHKDISLLLRAHSNETPELWQEAVPLVQYLMNTKTLANSSYTPHDLLFTSRPRPLSNWAHGPHVVKAGEDDDERHARAAHQRAQWVELERWERKRRDRRHQVRHPVFNVGDTVMSTRYSSFNNKLRLQLRGPFRVDRRNLTTGVYDLYNLRTGRTTSAKANTLAHYLTSGDRVTLQTQTEAPSTTGPPPHPTTSPSSPSTTATSTTSSSRVPAGGEGGTTKAKTNTIEHMEDEDDNDFDITADLVEGNMVIVHDAQESGNFEVAQLKRQGPDEDSIELHWYASKDLDSRKPVDRWKWTPTYYKTRTGARTQTPSGRGVEPALAEVPRARVLYSFPNLLNGRLPEAALRAYARASVEAASLGFTPTIGRRGAD